MKKKEKIKTSSQSNRVGTQGYSTAEKLISNPYSAILWSLHTCMSVRLNEMRKQVDLENADLKTINSWCNRMNKDLKDIKRMALKARWHIAQREAQK